MKSKTKPSVQVLFFAALLVSRLNAGLPENLAEKAVISSNSEYSADYRAHFVADGIIPKAGGRKDVKKAWCVQGETHRNGATITFTWKNDVTINTIIYYARTAWYGNECWKSYTLHTGKADAPLHQGTLKEIHGPQRIILPKPVTTKQLAIRFTSSFGGYNPGASEIQIFSSSPAQRDLAAFMKKQNPGILGIMPWVGEVKPKALRKLILALEELHPDSYTSAAAHLAALAKLENAAADDAAGAIAPSDIKERLKALQKDVLLFDVNELVTIKRHEIVASHVYTYHYEGFRPGGGLCTVKGNKVTELVSSATGQILDCDLSYDGATILFSWRRTRDEGYHLWTIRTDGTGLTRLTDGRWHDYNACWLPDGGIAFLSTRSPQFAYCWHAPVGTVYRMEADGSNVIQLSANYLNDFTPYPLENGRIIYSRWEYVDKPAIPIQSLWTINPDGTGLSHYFGNGVLSPGTFMEARQIPGTTRIICTMTGHNGPTRGAIGVIDRNLGLNAQKAIRNITPDVPVPDVDQGNGNTGGSKQYSCPQPLDRMRFLLSARGPVLVRTIDGSCQSAALPAPSDGMQYFSTQPVKRREAPPSIPSTLSHGKTTPTTTTAAASASIYLQDIYKGIEPEVKRGEVTRLRIVRELPKTVRIDPGLRSFGFQFPVISCGATYAGKKVLGDVTVKPDGSAFFKVPAGVPIYFIALDADGRAVQRMRSFTHLMPGEQQGCIGCHEYRHLSPAARLIDTYHQTPQNPQPPEWGVGGFDYSRIVQPVLDKHCVECHNPHQADGGVDLTGDQTDFFNVSYDVLARENQGRKGTKYVNWIPTYNGHEQNILEITPKVWGSHASRLAELILSGHPDKAGKKRIDLPELDRERIFAWIDLNVPYYGTSETAYPGNRGCRRIYPPSLDKVLAGVGKRRCASCHENGKVPRRVWTRITRPHLNAFLLAPLAESAGGTGACGKAVFHTTSDPDYQAILNTFEPMRKQLQEKPRMDMEGATPDPHLCRDCQ